VAEAASLDGERLEIKHLGPIEKLVLKPRPLTLLIGPQASGKSLVAQLLYFFRGLEGHIARRLLPEMLDDKAWRQAAIRSTLDGLRGVPFDCFSRDTAHLAYQCSIPEPVDWWVNVYSSHRRLRLSDGLDASLEAWAGKWIAEPMTLAHPLREKNVFVPTERSIIARLQAVSLQVLYDENQPEPFRTFADLLDRAGRRFDFSQNEPIMDDNGGSPVRRRWFHETVPELRALEREALLGEAYLMEQGPKIWKWRVLDAKGTPVTQGKDRRPIILPIEATSSGQCEAWPIFVLMAAYGLQEGVTFYIEEPETHLHPRAQVAVMRAIALLIGKGCRFVLTTHSPFLLYVLNNFLQTAERFGGRVPKGKTAVKPGQVAAYRLGVGQGGVSIIDDETGLVVVDELDDVASELGSEFEELL
jgi:hypothetical protein